LKKVFKRLKKFSKQTKGGTFMKKFLSIFIAVAMLMSFAGVFAGAPTAMAATTVTLTDDTSTLEWYGETMPNFGIPGTYNYDNYEYIYKMGATIHGYVDVAPANPWTVELMKTDFTVIDTVNMAPGGVNFSIGTGNVSEDGEYILRVNGNVADFPEPIFFESIFIQYNLALSVSDLSFSECTTPTSRTIEGWITRGSGQTVLVPVDVYVAYPGAPDGELAGYYTVAALSSGQFSITFPFDPVNDPDHVGNYRLFIRDLYDPGNYENDAMIYETIDNTPAKKNVTLSTYVSPSILYKDWANQPFIIVATTKN
jgi:hypothetical protein